MKISYKWLKEYIDINLTPGELDEILTQTGLEVGGIEKYQSIKGGLEGLVIGEVKTCEKHPNSDHLSITSVDVNGEELLPIVCGAPNVAAGQKVVVATVGTVLYDGDESFTIKKSKLRGELSMGMICAEDEIGLGEGHDGIMVLDADAPVGMPANEYFKVEDDTVIEIDLTPNRIDGASHIGVARDLAAFLKQTQQIDYHVPSVKEFMIDNTNTPIEVVVENEKACHRYSGVCISGVKIAPSPEWLQQRLKAIGLNPINNIVDITNYVLFETGQPLHAFDYAKVQGNKVVVKTMPQGQQFVTLDEVKRELNENDLMICNDTEPMCMAGVFGGLESGVSETTTNLFLESAYFDAVYVRKTARRHGLNTDASFRFERGTDPNNTVYALKRAAMLIKEIAGGTISSEIIDIYPNPVKNFTVEVDYNNITRLIGKDLGKETIKNILTALEISIEKEDDSKLTLSIPPYRVDVRREADVIEDILRIYGFNNIEVPHKVNSTLSYSPKPDEHKLKNMLADMLSGNGFNEIMNNSLTKASYYQDLESLSGENTVNIYNPLSSDLNALRQSLLFGGLENIAYNINRKSGDLKLYEFGSSYHHFVKEENDHPVKNYQENQHLSLFITGNKTQTSWNLKEEATNFFHLKAYVELVLKRLGFDIEKLKIKETQSDLFTEGLTYSAKKSQLVEMGLVSGKLLKNTNIDAPVFYADFNWENLMKGAMKNSVSYQDLPKYPSVKRDLALLLDKEVSFAQIKQIANNCEKKLLKSVSLFDVYQGEKLGADKKSYAVSFILQDNEKTLNDKQIDKIMQKLIKSYEKQVGAQIR